MDNCQTCKFYSALPPSCRLNPPHGVPIPTRDGSLMWVSGFPPTKPEFWCGKFERDPNAKSELES